jgi:CBS domain-containing protein
LTEINRPGSSVAYDGRIEQPVADGAKAPRVRPDPRTVMTIGQYCNREIISVARETSVVQAAALMREHHVGTVIVADDVSSRRVPVGIITDRDIVVEVVATGLDAQRLTVGDLMVGELVTIDEEAGFAEAIREMSLRGIRRMPVVSKGGALVGIITLDDVLHHLATPLAALSDLAGRSRRFEAMTRK